MKREDLEELHCITPIDNVPSILRRGILSYKKAKRVRHSSVALPSVQQRRERVTVPKGRPLHEYANLYICARNPMIYRRQSHHASLCVLRVSTDVLDLPGVVVSDQNAASGYVRFAPAPKGLRIVDKDLVFAESWAHPDDQIAHWRHKSIKCAEVLVPDVVEPEYIQGAYVSGKQGRQALQVIAGSLSITNNGHLFFQ